MPKLNVTKSTDSLTLPLDDLEKRIDEVAQRAFQLFERRGGEPGHALDDWLEAEREVLGWPAAELADKDGAYCLDMTLPGFDPNDIEVTVTPDELIVRANSEKKRDIMEGKVLWSEFGSNHIYRRFRVPAAICLDDVAANIDKGILHVTAPHLVPSPAVPAPAG